MVALDLFPAILSCGLSGYAQTVLAEVLMQSYGPRKRERVFLGATEIHELTGLGRPNIRRAIRELFDAGILSQDGEYYRFQKDYEQWKPTPGPLSNRLGGTILAWIRGSTERLGPDKNSRKSSVSTQTQQNENSVSTQTQSDMPSAVSTQTRSVSIQTHQTTVGCVYPDTVKHNIDCATRAPASEDTRDNTRELSSAARSRGDAIDSPKPAPEAPSYPDPETSIFIVHTGPHPEDEQSARRIWAAMWNQWKSEKLCSGFYQHQRWYKTDSWLEAIRTAVSRGVTPGDVRYLETIAGDVEVNGAKRHIRPNGVTRMQVAEKLAPYQQPAVKQEFTDQLAASLIGAKR
jgi:hypothetical protein